MLKHAITLALLTAASFQNLSAQKIILGGKLGVQSTAFSLRSSDEEVFLLLQSPSTGFLAGLTAEMKLSDNWSLQPNLLVVMRRGGITISEGRTQQLAVDLPINLLYKKDGFFVGLGPNVSYGISAKTKPYDKADETQDLYGSEKNYIKLKRFDFGLNSLLGYEFPGGISIAANYTPGFADILKQDIEELKIGTRMFGISIGYLFNKR